VTEPAPRCITCSDEAVPLRVVALAGGDAVCRDACGAEHRVAVDLVEPVAAGDDLLVHAGVAIRRLGGAA
jgi:hydrogenase expression/formation protein HypC